MEVGERIRQLREERGWSQDELARKLGYSSRSTICLIESCKNKVTSSMLLKYAKVFGVEPTELLGLGKPIKDADIELFEKVCQDEAMRNRLVAYALKLKEILDEENAPTS